MQRVLLEHFKTWLKADNRKPIVLRGARQVGKTWLVRTFADECKLDLIEINFERQPKLASLFTSNNPQTILINLESLINKKINCKKSLLFLDEIQVVPEILAKLRWFYEDMPELPVITAGSLLEFVLQQHTFSMPVGRIQYFFLEPLDFEEFLQAKGEKYLLQAIKEFALADNFPVILHEKALKLFQEYLIIGGMPEAVATWISSNSLEQTAMIHSNLINTYQDDFNKYTKKIAGNYLLELFQSIPKLLGKKFIYSKVNHNIRNENIKQALHLLQQARICHIVHGCYANGIPLGAEINHKSFKVILLDTGLVSSILDLKLHQFNTIDDILLVNNGAIAEQVVGQLLRRITPYYAIPELYYWNREATGSCAEVDYVIQHNHDIIPIEVKAGSTGKLRSLHQFMYEKKKKIAIRFYNGMVNVQDVTVKVSSSQIKYQMISLPFYLILQLPKILSALQC